MSNSRKEISALSRCSSKCCVCISPCAPQEVSASLLPVVQMEETEAREAARLLSEGYGREETQGRACALGALLCGLAAAPVLAGCAGTTSAHGARVSTGADPCCSALSILAFFRLGLYFVSILCID